MKTTILGIDLGGCMSGNSAYAFVQWHNKKAHIIELVKEPKHKEYHACAQFLEEMLSKHPVDAICIDAPFCLPQALIHPNYKPIEREAKGEIANPYLFRFTDYWLYKRYGLRPMPPAGDRIGRLTARMVQLLQKLSYKAPNVQVNGMSLPIYEVYPKQIALALGYEKYKEKTKTILKNFEIDTHLDEHLVDAVLSSYCGSEILKGNTIMPPDETKDEGWCYPLT